MKASLRSKLDQLSSRLQELDRLLSEESAAKDMDSFRKLAREHSELSSVVGLYSSYKLAEEDAEAARGMASDPEMAVTATLPEATDILARGSILSAETPKSTASCQPSGAG